MSTTVPDVLDLDSLHHDSPGLRAFIQNRLGGGKSEIVELLNWVICYLHLFSNGLSVTENVSKSHRTEHVPKGGGGQQPRGAAVVVHVGHGVGGVGHLVVHDGVDKHRHRVLGQNLQQRFVIGGGAGISLMQCWSSDSSPSHSEATWGAERRRPARIHNYSDGVIVCDTESWYQQRGIVMWLLSIHQANLVNTIPSNIRRPWGKQDDIFSEAHESQSLQLMSNSLTFAEPSVLW